MGLVEIIKDDFTAGTLLEQYAGNGSFNFPGTTAEIICPNSQNCNWDYNNGPYAPVLWAPDGFRSERPMPARFETRMNSFVRTHNYSLAGIVLCPQIALPQSMFYMTYYFNEARVIIDRQYGTGATRLYTSGAVPDPTTNPYLFRVYSNKSLTHGVWITDLTTPVFLAPNSVLFAYSTDGGTTWVNAHTRTIDLNYFRVGVFARKWATGAGDNCTATFEYFYAEQYNEEDFVQDPPIAGVGFDESISFPTSTSNQGPKLGTLNLDVGLHPVPTAIPIEEQIIFPPLSEDARHSVLHTDIGDVRSLGGQGFEEDIEIEIFGGPDYMDAKDDDDGKETLDGLGLNAMIAGDLTSDPFNTHPAGWYGAARDGTYYYNGEECTPTGPQGTSFGTLAGGKNRRCWPLWPGFPPLDAANATPLISAVLSADDTITFTGTAMAGENCYVSTELGWRFDGDFDISVDFTNWVEVGGTDGGVIIAARADNDNHFYARRRISGGVAENGRWDKDTRINGSYSGYAFVNAAGATSGRLRLVRAGTIVRSYYWTGSAWAQIGTDTNMGRAEPMAIAVGIYGAGSVNITVDVSNVVITSGTVMNKAAWANEASGTHRGILDEFPLRHVIAATDATLNILDPDNDKLWMRFIEGSGFVLNPGWTASAEVWVHRIKFRQGVLLLAWHGAMIRIDFNLTHAQIHRSITDTNRGAVKLTTHGNAYGGWAADSPTNNHIITRNTGTNWSTPSLNSWAIPDNDVNDCDLLFAGGYEYRVAATEAGLRVFKWRRWYIYGYINNEENISSPDWSDWDTANNVEWCLFDQTTGELFWHDKTNMYSAQKTNGGSSGWEDRMDESTFPAETTKALPGTREWRGQWVAVRYGSYLFIPADEGIYRVNWPSGSWELFYGNAASAATHKILPNYSYATALALGQDGATDVLIVGMWDGTAIIKLTNNTLHSQTPAKSNQRVDVVAA